MTIFASWYCTMKPLTTSGKGSVSVAGKHPLKRCRFRNWIRYSGYMNKLCTRTLYDENGYPHVCLDEAMKRRLEIKLIHAIVTTK